MASDKFGPIDPLHGDLLPHYLPLELNENKADLDGDDPNIKIGRITDGVLTLSVHARRNYTSGCNISLDADWLTELDERYRSIHGWLVLLVCALGIASNLTNIAGGLYTFWREVKK